MPAHANHAPRRNSQPVRRPAAVSAQRYAHSASTHALQDELTLAKAKIRALEAGNNTAEARIKYLDAKSIALEDKKKELTQQYNELLKKYEAKKGLLAAAEKQVTALREGWSAAKRAMERSMERPM